MSNLLATLSAELATASDVASASVVQVQSRRRPVAGVVFDTDLVVVPGQHLDDEAAPVRRADGQTFDGLVLGRDASTGLAVVRASGLGAPAATSADEPRPGHLALAVGRTWSGGVFAAFAPVVVVGGPLRTGRSTEVARVVRIGVTPHGALTGGALVNGAGQVLGVITAMAIRGTTVVVPAAIAWAAARALVEQGGARQGFIGVSSMPVTLPARQHGAGAASGLLVTGIVPDGPADAAGVLVGDVIVAFGDAAVTGADDLLTRLRVHQVGHAATVTVLRGGVTTAVAITVGTRPRG
ncbi:MAG: S1C family serine protease [Acidobacteriota bacterium]